jgi:2-polyprenyl-3-methyl-5-hydroxy-6-metoxy-1,4-benzoquinol methylase
MSSDNDYSLSNCDVSRRQEDEYAFPYHYLTQFSPDSFRQHVVDTWGINYASTIEFLLSKILVSAPTSVIDIGCGDGRLTRELSRRTDGVWICGVDYSSRAISLAKAMNQDIPRIDFRQVDICGETDLGLFDTAVLMEVFEHVPPPDAGAFMRGVRRLLKPQGRLHLTVPHANKPVEYKHFRHFTVDSLVASLGPEFDVIQVMPFERNGGIRRRLLNMLLYNRYVILNDHRMLDLAYRWYMKNLFYCVSESECQRIYLEAVAL